MVVMPFMGNKSIKMTGDDFFREQQSIQNLFNF